MRRLGWIFCGLVCIGGGLLFVFLVAPGLFSPLGWGRGWGDYGYGWGLVGPFGFPVIAVVMFVLCALMMGGMMLFGPSHMHNWRDRVPWQGDSNLAILQRRYSQGEITKEQFEEMKRDVDLVT